MPCEYHEDADIGMLPGPVQSTTLHELLSFQAYCGKALRCWISEALATSRSKRSYADRLRSMTAA